jgi:starch phosphorylase
MRNNMTNFRLFGSADFLMGPHLGNNLINRGIEEAAWAAMAELGHDLDDILAYE